MTYLSKEHQIDILKELGIINPTDRDLSIFSAYEAKVISLVFDKLSKIEQESLDKELKTKDFNNLDPVAKKIYNKCVNFYINKSKATANKFEEDFKKSLTQLINKSDYKYKI